MKLYDGVMEDSLIPNMNPMEQSPVVTKVINSQNGEEIFKEKMPYSEKRAFWEHYKFKRAQRWPLITDDSFQDFVSLNAKLNKLIKEQDRTRLNTNLYTERMNSREFFFKDNIWLVLSFSICLCCCPICLKLTKVWLELKSFDPWELAHSSFANGKMYQFVAIYIIHIFTYLQVACLSTLRR